MLNAKIINLLFLFSLCLFLNLNQLHKYDHLTPNRSEIDFLGSTIDQNLKTRILDYTKSVQGNL